MQNGDAPGIPVHENGAQSHINNGVVTVKLSDIADLARCPVCMGILKDTRTISVCMHRFCRTCIEAWLRTNIDNTCPQCRESFASRRNCKPDPTFDQLLKAIFGADTTTADEAFLEPPSNALAAAKTIGSELELLRKAQRYATTGKFDEEPQNGDGTSAGNGGGGGDGNNKNNGPVVVVHVSTTTAAAPGSLGMNTQNEATNGSLEDIKPQLVLKGRMKYKQRPASATVGSPFAAVASVGVDDDGNTNKKKKGNKKKSRPDSAMGTTTETGEETDMYSEDTNGGSGATTGTNTGTAAAPVFSPTKGTASTKYYGVRKFYPLNTGSNNQKLWYLAYSQEGGTSSTTYIPLGQYSTEEEAARIHDIHTLRTKGINPKKSTSVLNFPYLSTIYIRLLAHGIAPGATSTEYETASAKISAAVHGVGAPPGWLPPLELQKYIENPSNKTGGGGGKGSALGRPPSSTSGGAGSKGGGNGITHKNKKLKTSPSLTASGAAGIADQNYYGIQGQQQHGDVAYEPFVDVAALQAQELSKKFPYNEMIGPKSNRPTSVVVELRPADGLSLDKTWKMNWVTCPADTLISGIAAVIADGINKGETIVGGGEQSTMNSIKNSDLGGGGGDGNDFKVDEMDIDGSNTTKQQSIVLSPSSIYLNTANELDASADFMAVYREIGKSEGMLTLTPTMQIQDLVLLLADCGEDLVLEYSIQ